VSFRDIKGQDRAISFLKGSMEAGRISHAYIFYGPGGIGKRLTAVNFAKAVNCRGEGGEKPCDACPSCRKIDSSNHPDFFLLKPAKEGSAISIDDVRALIKDIGLKPYEGRKKFYVIDGASSMREEAQNAFLKTLEEPPSDSVIILIAENLGRLFSTIVSRSQTVKFFPLSTGDVKDALMNGYGMDATKAHVLAHISSGRLGEALKYRDESFFAKREKAMASLEKGTFFESDFDKLTKPDLKIYLNILLTWYRDILVSKAGGANGPGIVNIDRKETIAGEAEKMGYDRLERMIRQVISTIYCAEQNVNPKLAMAALGTTI